MLTIRVVKQIAIRHAATLNPSTVIAVPTFLAGPVDWCVTLGPSIANESVLMLGAFWDAVNLRWIPCDPLTTIWEDANRTSHFMRRDFVHAVCPQQIFECVGAESVHLTLI